MEVGGIRKSVVVLTVKSERKVTEEGVARCVKFKEGMFALKDKGFRGEEFYSLFRDLKCSFPLPASSKCFRRAIASQFAWDDVGAAFWFGTAYIATLNEFPALPSEIEFMARLSDLMDEDVKRAFEKNLWNGYAIQSFLGLLSSESLEEALDMYRGFSAATRGEEIAEHSSDVAMKVFNITIDDIEPSDVMPHEPTEKGQRMVSFWSSVERLFANLRIENEYAEQVGRNFEATEGFSDQPYLLALNQLSFLINATETGLVKPDYLRDIVRGFYEVFAEGDPKAQRVLALLENEPAE